MSENTDWVAEHLLGIPRGGCSESTGWITVVKGSQMMYKCHWCGRMFDMNGDDELCSKYPFPEIKLEDVMRALGELGHGIWIRYDVFRSEYHFTLIHDLGGRITDTDEPLEALCEWVRNSGDILGIDV